MSLNISANGHYLVDGTGTPFFWLGDTLWVLNKHSDQQVRAILDDRREIR